MLLKEEIKLECVCIVCPMSCRITVTKSGEEFVVSGNNCKRGEKHAINEYICPQRMLTSTVKVENGTLPRLPVISTSEIPKDKIRECLEELYKVSVKAPIKDGQIIIKDICGTGVDIKSSRSMV